MQSITPAGGGTSGGAPRLRIVTSSPQTFAACSSRPASPMTTARQCPATSARESALTMISGPTPAASPIVTAMTGRVPRSKLVMGMG